MMGDDGARVATVKVVALVTDNPSVFTLVLEHYGIGAVQPTPFTRGWISTSPATRSRSIPPWPPRSWRRAPSSSMPACTSPRLALTPSPSSNARVDPLDQRASADRWRSDEPSRQIVLPEVWPLTPCEHRSAEDMKPEIEAWEAKVLAEREAELERRAARDAAKPPRNPRPNR